MNYYCLKSALQFLLFTYSAFQSFLVDLHFMKCFEGTLTSPLRITYLNVMASFWAFGSKQI